MFWKFTIHHEGLDFLFFDFDKTKKDATSESENQKKSIFSVNVHLADCQFFFSTGTFPIDTTKTRLQVQGQTIDARLKEIKYRGMIHALKRIYAEEGVRALYSG